jgi:DNA anti-recombination protein RmuC
MGGIGADVIWERLEKITDKMQEQSDNTTQILSKFHNTLSNMGDDCEVLKTQQSSCLGMHKDRKSLCSFADQNDTVTQTFNKMANTLDNFVARTDNALKETTKMNKMLFVLVVFLVAAVVGLVGVKIAIPGF